MPPAMLNTALQMLGGSALKLAVYSRTALRPGRGVDYRRMPEQPAAAAHEKATNRVPIRGFVVGCGQWCSSGALPLSPEAPPLRISKEPQTSSIVGSFTLSSDSGVPTIMT